MDSELPEEFEAGETIPRPPEEEPTPSNSSSDTSNDSDRDPIETLLGLFLRTPYRGLPLPLGTESISEPTPEDGRGINREVEAAEEGPPDAATAASLDALALGEEVEA